MHPNLQIQQEQIAASGEAHLSKAPQTRDRQLELWRFEQPLHDFVVAQNRQYPTELRIVMLSMWG